MAVLAAPYGYASTVIFRPCLCAESIIRTANPMSLKLVLFRWHIWTCESVAAANEMTSP
jgi:hypothetical protein